MRTYLVVIMYDGTYQLWFEASSAKACIKHQRDIHVLACIKHQRRIYTFYTRCCSVFTVTTGTFDPPTHMLTYMWEVVSAEISCTTFEEKSECWNLVANQIHSLSLFENYHTLCAFVATDDHPTIQHVARYQRDRWLLSEQPQKFIPFCYYLHLLV